MAKMYDSVKVEVQHEIQIVEAMKVEQGDTIVICTKESLSRELIMSMRGSLMEYFEPMGVKCIIIAADEIFHFRPLEKEFPE